MDSAALGGRAIRLEAPGVSGRRLAVGAVRADDRRAFFRIAGRHQPAQRQWHAVGIAQVGEAIEEGQALGLGDAVHLVQAARAECTQVEALEHGQRLHHRREARVLEPADDVAAAVVAAQAALGHAQAVAGQVIGRQQATVRGHVGGDLLGDAPAVEGVGAVGGDLA